MRRAASTPAGFMSRLLAGPFEARSVKARVLWAADEVGEGDDDVCGTEGGAY